MTQANGYISKSNDTTIPLVSTFIAGWLVGTYIAACLSLYTILASISFIQVWMPTVCITTICLIWLGGASLNFPTTPRALVLYLYRLVFRPATIVSIGTAIYCGAISGPATGWDPLDFWLFKTHYILTEPNREAVESLLTNGRHPFLLMYLLTPIAVLFGNVAGPILWWVFWILLPFLLVSFARTILTERENSLLVSTCLVYGMLTLPLIENHALLYGYAELPLAVLSLCMSFHGYKAISMGGWKHWLYFVLYCFLATQIKNSGLLYSTVCICSVFAILIFRRLSSLSRAHILMVSGLITAIAAFSFWLVPNSEAWRALLDAHLGDTSISTANIKLIFDVLMRAFIVNQSYSTAVPLLFFSLLFWKPSNALEHDGCRFLALNLLGIVGAIVILLSLDPRFLGNSLPELDTSFSRLFLPSYPIIVLLSITRIKSLTRARQ